MTGFISWLELAAKISLLSIFFVSFCLSLRRFPSDWLRIPLFSIATLPFFIVYKFAIALGKGSLLNGLYTAILIILCALFIGLATQRFSTKKDSLQSLSELVQQHKVFIFLLIGIFIFFSLRGLYLEYPSDAVIYFQRVGQSNQDQAINIRALWSYSAGDTFFSSFQHWLVGTDHLMRAKLRIVAAISICILCSAVYRLSLWCTHHKASSSIAVLLFLGFYGNLQISFLLYKILQGATLAMVVYLEAIPALYGLLSSKKVGLLITPQRVLNLSTISLAIWICLDCHKEKLLYFFCIIFSYCFFVTAKKIAQRKSPSGLTIALLLSISIFLTILCFSKKAIATGASPTISSWFSINGQMLFSYWPMPPNSALILLDIGVIVLAAILLINYRMDSREFFMAAIAIGPFFLLINPIAVTALIKLTSPNNLYRIIAGGLPWIFLPLAGHALKRDMSIKFAALTALLVMMSGLAYAPMYGKLPHIFNRLPPYADGKDLAPIVHHLLDASNAQRDNLLKTNSAESDRLFNVLAPPYVNSYLAAWPNFLLSSNRWLSNDVEANGPNIGHVYGSAVTITELAGTIPYATFDAVVIDRRDHLSYQSWLGQQTQHWASDLIASQQTLLAGVSLRNYLENQPQLFFEKTLELNGFQVYQKVAQ